MIWAVPDPAIISGSVLELLLHFLVPIGAVAGASPIAELIAACLPLQSSFPSVNLLIFLKYSDIEGEMFVHNVTG